MKCSILTLEKVFDGHKRKIEILTPAGKLVTINEGEAENGERI